MKKLENPELEELKDYLRNTILPKLQEIQCDLFGNEFCTIEVGVGTSGRYITAFASVVIDGEILDSISLHLSVFDGQECIESECIELTEFIKKYTA